MLRFCLSSVLERAILEDRREYLRQNGYESQIVPLFDPEISPRNLAIIAHRMTSHPTIVTHKIKT